MNELVDEAIEEDEVGPFVKGSAIAPQCGYSETVLDHLRCYREDVDVPNILASPDEFRAVLERHSGWTAVPQASADAEFVGGSDVLEELDTRGELAETLTA